VGEDCGPWAVGGEQAGLMAGDEEYRSRGEREYARCRIADYSLLRIAGVSLRGRRWEVEKENKLMPRGAILPFAERMIFTGVPDRYSREAILLFLPTNLHGFARIGAWFARFHRSKQVPVCYWEGISGLPLAI